jgi:hypothetical protein
VIEFIRNVPIPIIVVLLVAFSYPIVARLLLNAVYPKRLRILELGNELVRDSRLLKSQREFVALSLNINGKAWPLLLIAFLLPVFVVRTLFSKSFREGSPEENLLVSLSKDPRYVELQDLEVASMFAANPIAGILVGLEIATLAVTGLIFFIGFAGTQKLVIRVLGATALRERRKIQIAV